MTRTIPGKIGVAGVAIVVAIASALAAQGCAVWSRVDCAEKAACSSSASTGGPDDAAGGADDDAGGAYADGPAAATDSGGDGGVTDASRSGADADADAGTFDGAARDGATADAAATDAGSPVRDASTDASGDACGAYACAPAAPAGWNGPVALAEVPAGSALPACPGGFEALMDASLGLSAPAATCGCACGAAGKATGQVCSATGTFHSDQMCSASPCASVAVSSASGSCVAVPGNRCGSGGSFDLAATPTPSGGSCAPQVTTATVPATWATSARLCSYVGAPADAGGCGGAGACVAPPPSPYGAGLCVYSSADPPPAACPAGYQANAPIVLYAGTDDTRGCGACTCSGPSGGSCAGTVSLFGGGGCTGSSGAASYTLGTACRAYSGLSPVPGSIEASVTVNAGSCSVQAAPRPTGAVTPTTPTTVCCM